MIAGTEHGVYLETNRSWSIDDRRLNFQFGTQNGWEIQDGKRLRLVKNALYAGADPRVLAVLRRRRRPLRMEALGRRQLRQGAAGTGHPRRPWRAPCRFRDVS